MKKMENKLEKFDLEKETRELMVYKTKEQKWNDKDIHHYLNSQKDLKIKKNKSQIVYINNEIRMEFYYESNSLWWTNLEWENKEISEIKEIPSNKVCISISNDFLKSNGLDNKYMKFKDIEHDTAIIYNKKREQSKQYITAINVNYNYDVEGIPIFGSGAKLKTVLDGKKNIVEWYRFWRDFEPIEKRKIITSEMAIRLFHMHPVYEKMMRSKIEIEFFKPKLGYYAFPPRINQNILFPVYEIRGHIQNSVGVDQIICEYVPAVFESLDKIKEMKVFNGYELCGDILHYLKK